MSKTKNISDIPRMNDDQLAEFWDAHEPENFEGWEEANLKFKKLPKKLIQLRLDPADVRVTSTQKPKSSTTQ